MKQLFVFLGSVLMAGLLIISSGAVTNRFPAEWPVLVMTALGGIVFYGFVRMMNAFDRKVRGEKASKDPLQLLDPSTDAYYCDAMEELEGDNLHKATWAKALSESRGGLKAAEALYIKLRARHLAEERKAHLFRRKLATIVLLVTLLVFAVWATLT